MQQISPNTPPTIPPPENSQETKRSRGGVFLWLCLSLAFGAGNALIEYFVTYRESHDSAVASGAALFGLTFPGIIASLFLIGRKFRRFDRWVLVYAITAGIMLSVMSNSLLQR